MLLRRGTWADRALDVTVYGATGFTGKLVARYLLASRNARIGLAGRSLEKLEATRAELCQADDSWDPALIVADDAESLAALASGTRVVISTAGPFALCGTPLVAACVQAQTDCTRAPHPSAARPAHLGTPHPKTRAPREPL
jgi:short subunit dehydrogenase-like uncharacterized protein